MPALDQDRNGCPGSSQSYAPSNDGNKEDTAPRKSFDSSTSSRSEVSLSFTTEADLASQLSIIMGISARKSLLKSLSEKRLHSAYELRPGDLASASSTSSCSSMEIGSAALGSRQPSSADEEEEDVLMSAHSSFEGNTLQQKRSCSSSYLCSDHAAAELFLRLNHARQTVAFVQSQVANFSALDKACMSVWEGLDLLAGLREYETALMGQDDDAVQGLSLIDHAFQTAEACRLAHPSQDWLHFVGLIHSLGKLLSHPRIANLPQWAICGESFPVGCKFDPAIAFSHFFSVNPDRRSRVYSHPTGAYKPGEGLSSVSMSWSAAEYLYMLLLLNCTELPPQALFVIRYQKFLSLECSKSYRALMSEADRLHAPWLAEFRSLSEFKPKVLEGRLGDADLREYYGGLIRKYIPSGRLRF